MTLELAFISKSLRQICESRSTAEKKFPNAVVDNLIRRIADIRAAHRISDLPPILFLTETQEGNDYVVVNISDGYQLIFCANHINPPLLENGKTDWNKVDRVKLIEIRNRND